MSIAVPFFNFLIYLVVGAIFIALSPLDREIPRLSGYNNNFLNVLSIIALTYMVGYIIGLIGKLLFIFFDKGAKRSQEKNSLSKIHPRWDDFVLIKYAEQFNVLYIYAREYNFRRSMSVVMLVLGVCSICNPYPYPYHDMHMHLISSWIYFILFLFFLIATYQMTYKVANVLNKPFKFSPFNKRESI